MSARRLSESAFRPPDMDDQTWARICARARSLAAAAPPLSTSQRQVIQDAFGGDGL